MSGSDKYINIIKYNKAQIKDIILQYNNFKVGEFIIYIIKKQIYQGNVLYLDILIYQEVNKNTFGFPGVIQHEMDFFRDERFANCNWLYCFNYKGSAKNLSNYELITIIKHMQIIQNLNAFM